MTLPEWKDLSTITRRSPERIYNLIKAELDGPEPVVNNYKATVSVMDDQSTPSPVGGANVVLNNKSDPSKTYSGTTGSAGGCTINNIPAGIYTVTATADGMKDYTGDSDVIITDSNITIDIEMTTTTT